jgi:succinoglycan biosynthesis protein ExoA
MSGSEAAPVAPPSVSVVIPCRNEADMIRRVVESVLATDYDRGRLEVIVVDGLSDDGTREIVAELAAADPRLRLLDNPGRVIPSALNRALGAARGEIIVRMDAHTTYPPDYVRRCVEGLVSTGADNVGGVCITRPREPTLRAHAFATALSHRFGIGNARYKLGITAPTEVDAVPFGCMWRRTMLELGPYDERVARSEDFDFNRRLRARGGRLLLLPEITSYYHARSRWGEFLRHSVSNGFWVAYPMAFVPFRGSWRHYVPLMFLLALAIPALLALRWRWALVPLAAVAGAYLLAALAAAVHAAVRERRLALAGLLPLVFPALHLAYGAGTAWGLVRVAAVRAAGLRGRRAGGSARAA